MKTILTTFLLSLVFWLYSDLTLLRAEDLQRFEYTATKMGIPVRLIFYAKNEVLAERVSDDIFHRFDELNLSLSDYDPESEIIQVCRKSGDTNDFVPLSPDLYEILKRSRFFTDMTHGAFDITVSPLVKLWRRSRSFRQLPPEEYLKEAYLLVGNRNWELQAEKGLRILKKGVRFDVGGIAKGYALDEGKMIFQKSGITRFLLNAGGDLCLGDPPPDQKGWRIGIVSLSLEKKAKAAIYMELAQCGVASSGDSFRFVEIDGIRYSHLIDPRSGKPMTTHRIVTVIAPEATTADALASACSILSPQEGLELINTQPGMELLIFQAKENTVATSSWNTDQMEIYSTKFFIPFIPEILKKAIKSP